MATQFYYNIDIDNVDFAASPTEEGEIGYNAGSNVAELHDGTAVRALAFAGAGGAPLATADQVIDSARVIDINGNSLALTGLASDSGAAGVLTSLDGSDNFFTRTLESVRTLRGIVDPVNNTTVAWYVGQFYANTTNQTIWVAMIQSTNPDVSGVGAVWQTVANNLASQNQVLTSLRVIDTGFNNLLITGIGRVSQNGDDVATLDDASGTLGRVNVASLRVLSKGSAPINGTDVAYYVGQLLVDTASGNVYRASTASSLPDVSGANSVWEQIIGASGNYSQTFILGDWSAPSGGNRTLTVTAATHGKGINPMIQVFETNGVSVDQVTPAAISFDTSNGDVTITVVDGQEFTGRILISG